MRKIAAAGLVVLLVAVFAAGALAIGPGGMSMGMMDMGAGSSMTPEQSQKFDKFQKDVLPLRQKMLRLRTELMSLRAQETPDSEALAAKQKEMMDVRTEIHKRASEAGFAGAGMGLCRGGGMKGMSKGMGMGMGMGM